MVSYDDCISENIPSRFHNEAIVWSREAVPAKRHDLDRNYDNELDNFHSELAYHDENIPDRYDDVASLHYQEEFYNDDSIEYSKHNDFYIHENNYHNNDHQYVNRINIDEIQRPSSLFDCYDADDEYYSEKMPIRQISIQEKECDDISLECSEDSFRDEQYCPQFQTKRFERYEENSPQDVIHRIETVMGHLVNYLSKLEGPVLHEYKNPHSDDQSVDSVSSFFHNILKYNASPFKQFDNIARQRVFTSMTLIMSFIHTLLLSNRTTTTREVYYVFVTHFRSQRECDSAILDVAKCLDVPRRALGLSASPKGWFCGSVEIIRRGTLPSGKDVSGSIDGTALSSVQGLPITREWIDRDEKGITEEGVEIKVTSKDAKVIVVIEKEGVYNRLAEERIFDKLPCILITGKGFPDLATRALVRTLHRDLGLPVVGLCDSNPFGISVLALYYCAGDRMGVDGNMKYSVPISWIGLRPSTVSNLKDRLPKEVFQKLTDRDYKRIGALLDKTHSFMNENREREILAMKEAGYKVELEALYWLGPDYMGDWVVNQLQSVDDKNEWKRVAI